MKTYIVTDKHLIYKSGLRIEQKHENCFQLLGANDELYLNTSKSFINNWLKDSWIKEVHKPEFTKNDVIQILHEYDNHFVEDAKPCDFVALVDSFAINKKRT